tara:strand:+ start:1636 stop:3438 length:1803 start_codon:yes stop_codon:yes gene_type:complete
MLIFYDCSKKNSKKYLHQESFFDFKNINDSFYFKADNSGDENYFYDEATGIFIFFKGFFISNDELRKEKGNKESEIIFNKYIKEGEKFIDDLDGFFLIVVFDSKINALYVCNDHIGSEDLYLAKKQDTFCISTDIETIKAEFSYNEICDSRVNSFFKYIHARGNETFFKGISQIMGGQIAKIEKNKLNFIDYLSYDLKKYTSLKTEEDYINAYKKKFLQSVDACMQTEEPKIGVALSGGLDSSSVACVAAKISTQKIEAYTAEFTELTGIEKRKTFESNFSEDVIKKLNIKHERVDIKNYGAVSYLKNRVNNNKEPDLLVNGYIHEKIFGRLKKNGTNLYLDGYGGDSIISHGYNRLHELGSSFNIIELFNEIKHLYKRNGQTPKYFSSLKTYMLSNLVPSFIHWLYKSNFSEKPQQLVWSKRLRKNNLKNNLYSELKDVYGYYPLQFEGDSSAVHLKDVTNPIIGMSVRSVKNLARKFNVKIRFPFLAKGLIELSLCTPEHLKLKEGINRYVFRKSVEELIPESVFNRVTKSDLSPLSQKEVKNIDFSEIQELIKRYCPDLFDTNYLKQLFRQNEDYVFEKYQVYSFLEWLSHNDIKIK